MTDVDQFRTVQRASHAEFPTGEWVLTPDVPASTETATNESGQTMWVEIDGGTVTVVEVDGVTIGSRVEGMFLVRPGSTIAITYSAAPTWQWFYAL